MSHAETAPPLANEQILKKPFGSFMRAHPRVFGMGLLTLLGTNLLDAIPPLLIGRAIDQISQGSPWREVLITVLILLVTSTGLAFMRYAWRIYWGQFHHTVAEDLRRRIFGKFLILSANFFRKSSVGELMSLINNDVNSFRMAIGPGLLILLDGVFMGLILPPLMFWISPSWTWKSLILMPVVPFFIYTILQKIHRHYKQQQDRYSEMSGRAQEIISGIRVIKGYAVEDRQLNIFNGFSGAFADACNRVARTDAYFAPVLQLASGTGAAIALVVGAPEVMAGTVSIGSFFAFYQYIRRMAWPMSALGMGLSMIQQGRASFDRIGQLLQATVDVPDEGDISLSEFRDLEVSHLTYCHQGQANPSLIDVSLRIEAGQSVGIVGPTGSGKSTLVDLLCRLYPAPEGSIHINGYAIERLKLTSLRQLIACVPQESFLFSDKVRSNLELDIRLPDHEVEGAVSVVGMDSEVRQLPSGFESQLGERGVNLSGGQKQRLTLARAILRRSPVLILDDSLSAVDAHTEERILKQIRDISGGGQGHRPTVMVISHRITNLNWCDNIIVLNNGRIEATGTHSQLLVTSPTYRHLHDIQSQSPAEVAP